MHRSTTARNATLVAVTVAVAWLYGAGTAHAQSPELAMREFASGQIKKGVRSVGFGGDGATWGNYALVYRDAGNALVDAGVTRYTNGNEFSFTAVGATTPDLWHGLTIYVIALSQHAAGIRLTLSSPGLGASARELRGGGADEALFAKVAMPLGNGWSAGVLLSYELSQFDAAAPPSDPARASIDYQTRWRPSGGFGVVWQPNARLLLGTRAILNHDWEVRTDDAGTTEGLSRSYEARLGASVSPWAGGIVDAGGTWLYRRSGLAGTVKTALHPNLGIEQVFFNRAFAVRAGLDETSLGGGVTVRRRPIQVDVAYIRDLGKARVGDLFGDTSNSVLATLTFDLTWTRSPPPVAATRG